MAGPGLIVLLLAALVLAGLVALVAVAVVGVRAPAPPPSRAAEAARRHAAVVHAIALVALVLTLAAGPTLVAGRPADLTQGVLLGLVPAVAGLAFAAVQVVGEATWPRPSGTVRRAPLARRTARDVAPGRLRRVTWAWALLAVVTLVACGLVADDGRALTRTWDLGSRSASPFPGWYYGVPLMLAVAVVLLAAEGLLRLVARRPVVSDADPAWDLALRRLSAHRALRGAQLVLAWTAAGVLLVAGGPLRNVGTRYGLDGEVAELLPMHHLGTAAVVLGLVVALAGLVIALVPATAVGELRPAPAEHRDRTPA
ncbi:hypothetical protein [Cellulomonas sp. ATA003]|uniref:hypothetical protein n=1 Tax=Cellulomonas sp. ATA003 TaxID=3073064 RepID=UPI002873ED6D|nr:hypothetical protein [Cellulomonas sp. ATA003]WNB85983.1 hypothetical protein REH70_01380 [Cellulomonas sp. ATA003]